MKYFLYLTFKKKKILHSCKQKYKFAFINRRALRLTNRITS